MEQRFCGTRSADYLQNWNHDRREPRRSATAKSDLQQSQKHGERSEYQAIMRQGKTQCQEVKAQFAKQIVAPVITYRNIYFPR
jgi:hypothetical protein